MHECQTQEFFTFPSHQTQASLMQNFETKNISRHKNIHIILSSSICHPPCILKTAIGESLGKVLEQHGIVVEKRTSLDPPLSNFKKESRFSFLNRQVIHWPIPRASQLDKSKIIFRSGIIGASTQVEAINML